MKSKELFNMKSPKSHVKLLLEKQKSKLNDNFVKHPKIYIFSMGLLIIVGVIYNALRQPKSLGQAPIDLVTQAYDSALKPSFNDLSSTPNIWQAPELLKLEKDLNRILAKDSLTSKDSIQLKLIDQQLNRFLPPPNIRTHVED